MLLVLAIWGTIVFKIYNGLTVKQIINKPVTSGQNFAMKQNVLDSYSLHSYPDDPFLSILTDTAAQNITDTILPRSNTYKLLQPLPDLPVYYGLLENEKNKTAIIMWKNHYEHVNEGMVLDELKIGSVSAEQITVKLQGEKYTISIAGKEKINNEKVSNSR